MTFPITPEEYRQLGEGARQKGACADLSTPSGRYSFAVNMHFHDMAERLAQGGDFDELIGEHIQNTRKWAGLFGVTL